MNFILHPNEKSYVVYDQGDDFIQRVHRRYKHNFMAKIEPRNCEQAIALDLPKTKSYLIVLRNEKTGMNEIL